MQQEVPTVPLPDQVSGSTGYVISFKPIGVRAILATATQRLPYRYEPLLAAGPPHSTLCHAQVVGANGAQLARCLQRLREITASSRTLHLDRIAIIGGRFLVMQAVDPRIELQHAAMVAALALRPFLDTQATPAAKAENLSLTPHQQWCLEQFGHPLVLPDVANGEFARKLHVSFGYKANGEPITNSTPVRHPTHPLISNVHLAKMGPRGVVKAYYDV